MSDKEKRVTAYHEAGHALTAWAMPNLDPVHKVTILPRGRSLGHTLVLPLEDRYTQTRSEILDQLVYALGGRAAEELVFHEPTTGASNDIEKATELARAMVTEYGMSAKLGAVKYGTGDAEPFMGRDYGHQRDYSEDIAADIDAEVRDLIEGAHDEAWEILEQYRDVLDAMVLELVEKETLTKDDLERILAPVRKRPPHNTFTALRQAHAERPPADRDPAVAAQGRGQRAERRERHHGNGSGNGGRRTGRQSSRRTEPPARRARAYFGPQPVRSSRHRRRAARRTGGRRAGRLGPGTTRRPGQHPAMTGRPVGDGSAVERRARRPRRAEAAVRELLIADRRGPRPGRPARPRPPGWRAPTPRSSAGCSSTRTTSCRRPSTRTTTSSCW